MKAVPVLLCLALAHGVTANIFQQARQAPESLDIQALDPIDQYQQQHRNQPSESEQQRDQHAVQYGQQDQQQQDQHQRNQPRDQMQEEHHHQRNQQQHQRLTWGEQQKTMFKNQQQQDQYPQPAGQQVQYQLPYTQQSQEQDKNQYQYPTHKHSHYSQQSHQRRNHRHSDSSSNESSQSSQESRERRHHNHANKKWESTPEAYVMNQQNQMVAYANAKAWDNLQQTVNPNIPPKSKQDIEKIFGDAEKAMRPITEEEKVKFHETYDLATRQENSDADLNATQLAQKHNYPVEQHTIQTDDGYQLTLFRIPPKKQNIRDVQKRPVVFLMHGISGSADDWLLMGPGKSLAYLLADNDYDVWLGNARGNKYSNQHVSKHAAVDDFWQYSNDEIALHDLPAMIDYALETANQEKLYYIGHAQGNTAFFALTATRPEYNDKIIMMYALSPMVYMTNVRSPLFRMIAPTSKFHGYLQQQLGNGAFTPSKQMIQAVGGAMLQNKIGCKKVSANVNYVMAGVNVDESSTELIPVVMRHQPAGTSTKVIKHYGQGVSSQEFRRYDYGSKVNAKVYGSEQPPKYEMEKVQAPVTLYYSAEDWLAHPQDVARLQNELPNVREAYQVPEQHFGHMDFQFSTKAPEMVYRRLIESMQTSQQSA